jgi:hypothetical protein
MTDQRVPTRMKRSRCWVCLLGVPNFGKVTGGILERREDEQSRTQKGFQARRRGSVGLGAVN